VSDTSLLIYLADAILIVHVLFVLFVVVGLLAIYTGGFLHWQWVRNRLFRILHLVAIGIVVVQAWLGLICPLTTWEMALRSQAGAETYAGSFIQFWLHRLLYLTAPEWVFIVLYTGFGCLVMVSWYLVRPKGREK
jgi:drug/metabolite transporter superfamily protein YnfA